MCVPADTNAVPGELEFATCERDSPEFWTNDPVICTAVVTNGLGYTTDMSLTRNGVTVLHVQKAKIISNRPAYGPIGLSPPLAPGDYTCQVTISGRVAAERSFVVRP